MLFIGASNELGEFESGITAALLGTVPAVMVGGVGTLLVVGWWMKLFPPLRKADKFSAMASRSKTGTPAPHTSRHRWASRHSEAQAPDNGW